jgi:hypothetical protein
VDEVAKNELDEDVDRIAFGGQEIRNETRCGKDGRIRQKCHDLVPPLSSRRSSGNDA